MARHEIRRSAESNPLILRRGSSASRLRSRTRWNLQNVAYTGIAFLMVIHLVTFSIQFEEDVTPLTRAVTGSVTFAAIGDWGRRGGYRQNETAVALGTVIPSNISFIASVGDNFYNDGVTSVEDSHFIQSFQRVYDHPRLRTVPWYLALGNHDHRGSFAAQIQYSDLSDRWNMPARYFPLQVSTQLLAVYLDTTSFINSPDNSTLRRTRSIDAERQLSWLRHVLAAPPSTTRFIIFGHHNMYSSSVADHQGELSVRDRIEPILRPYSDRIIAYVAGHEHALMHMQPYGKPGQTPLSNIEHFVTGAGSKLRPIVLAPPSRDSYWRACCGVLAFSRNESVPRTVWTRDVNGFFIFRLHGHTFYATAYDDSANVIYEYERQLPPL